MVAVWSGEDVMACSALYIGCKFALPRFIGVTMKFEPADTD